MALIKCADCEKEFSDKAKVCPNCGCPVKKMKKGKKKIIIFLIIILLLICGILAYIFVPKYLKELDKNKNKIDNALECYYTSGSYFGDYKLEFYFSGKKMIKIVDFYIDNCNYYPEDDDRFKACAINYYGYEDYKTANNVGFIKRPIDVLNEPKMAHSLITLNDIRAKDTPDDVKIKLKDYTCKVKTNLIEGENEIIPADQRLKNILLKKGYTAKTQNVYVWNFGSGSDIMYNELNFNTKVFKTYSNGNGLRLEISYNYGTGVVEFDSDYGYYTTDIKWDLNKGRWNCTSSINNWCNTYGQKYVDNEMVNLLDEFRELENIANVYDKEL